MPHEPRGTLPIKSDQDVVATRQLVRTLTQELKFSLVDQTKMVTAASELSRNTLVHGHGGQMHWEVLEQPARRGLRLQFEDRGPGIPDVKQALVDGWTSNKGMGLGLPGSKRLVHEFELESAPGQGTRVSIIRWK